MLTELMTEYQREVEQPFVDSLTNLYNHGIFLLSLGREIKRSERHGGPLTLAFIDIDSFSDFNHDHGPIEGDRILMEIARITFSHIRQSDMGARYAGDVFALILVETNGGTALIPLERIRQSVEKFSKGTCTVSVGFASYPKDALDMESLIEKARKALLKAKLRGKNRTCSVEAEYEPQVEVQPRILVVDDDPLNLKLLAGLLSSLRYQVHTVGSGREALDLVKRTDFDLIFLDVMMPGMDGYEVCRRLKGNEDNRLIPVVMLTALDSSEAKIKGIESGADDFITKPADRMELVARTKSLINIKNANRKLVSMENLLISLANTVESKDAYTQGHVERVSNLAVAVGRRFQLPEKEIAVLRLGGALHDIGKIAVPEAILNKTGDLSKEEWEVLKTHPELGYRICLPLKKHLGSALDMVRHHHEKLDGSGYPAGLRGGDIRQPARIMTAVDIYDALTTERSYHEARSRHEACDMLVKESEDKKLDAEVVHQLISIVLG